MDTFNDLDWIGEDVFIIGGGPSLRGVDLSQLECRKVITINMGYRLVRPTLAYFGSILLLIRCYRKNDFQQIQSPRAALESQLWNVKHPHGCHTIETTECDWGESLESGLPCFSNSGLVCLNLADLLGAQNIYLLGFDMKSSGPKTENWHTDYPEGMRPPSEHYQTYLSDFERVAHYCNAQVWNCNPDSELKLFPYRPLDEALS